ncbi:hypothetical protein PG990_013826 [Apiospora arundinis]
MSILKTSTPNLNFKKLAEIGPYKNEASARESWRQTKNRLMAAAGVDKNGKNIDEQAETPNSKPAKAPPKPAAKRKRAAPKATAPTTPTAADSNDDYVDDDEDAAVNNPMTSPTPTKKARRGTTAAGSGRKKKNVIQTEETFLEPVFDDDEEQQMQSLKLEDASTYYTSGNQPGAGSMMVDEA